MVKELTAEEKAAAKAEAEAKAKAKAEEKAAAKAEAEARAAEKAAEKAAAKAEGPEIYLFPGDDAIEMNEVKYAGGLKDGDGKEIPTLFVRVCGRGITLKKGVTVLMSKSCRITLGKIKSISVNSRAIG